ncbi:MAG: glycosyltransferase [Chloroflexota bacterium]|nr:MAG: glycosyltransferase [Chloroflexota bacterium]
MQPFSDKDLFGSCRVGCPSCPQGCFREAGQRIGSPRARAMGKASVQAGADSVCPMEESRKVPRVSIGLPVFNGEKYLRLALDALLDQDYKDFELIICDNASTDHTEEICQEYAARDPRVLYYRHETNLGATVNFRCVFELSAGEYFMWAAHDDLWDKSYLRRCLAGLEDNPAAVLCCTQIVFLDDDGNVRENYAYNNFDTVGLNVQERVHALISTLGWYAIYGLMRSDAIRRTRPFVDAFGNDVLWLLQMSLLGEFVKLPDPLFYYRILNQSKDLSAYMAGLNPAMEQDVPARPYTSMARNLRRIVESSNLDDDVKARIQNDIVGTLSLHNQDWQACIVRENAPLVRSADRTTPANVLEVLRAAPEQMRAFVAEAIRLDGQVEVGHLRQTVETAEGVALTERLRVAAESEAQGDQPAMLQSYLSMARSFASIKVWRAARVALELALDLDPSSEEARRALEALERKENETPPTAAAHPADRLSDTASLVPGVKWTAPILNFSGYARLGRDTILSLHRRRVPVAVEPYAVDQHFVAQLKQRPVEFQLWNRLLQTRRDCPVYVCLHPAADWRGDDVFALHRRQNPGYQAYVGATMFETDRLPAGWSSACNGMDEVWVPSSFNRETFIRAGVDPARIQVIPFGMDTRGYDPAEVQPLRIEERRGFAFLSTFQWSKRKGWDVLLKAYLSAFTPSDDVCLLLRTYPDRIKTPPILERIANYVRQLGLDPAHIPAIILLENFVPDEKMPSLYAAGDAFVLPSRGEGWGIPYMEAMAMGLPVIGTRWSAQLDFMNDENSYLIDIEGLVAVDRQQSMEHPQFTPDQKWAEPSASHTAAVMRHVYDHREEARSKGARARRDIQENWTLDRAADKIADRLCQLTSAKSARRRSNDKPVSLSARGGGAEPSVGASSILWQAPIYDPSGYADEARNFILGLHANGLPVSARAVGRQSDVFRRQLDASTQRTLEHSLGMTVHPDFISVMHFPAYAFARLPEAAYNIGRVMFETDGLPPDWVAKCNEMDEIWVPTRFNMQTFRNAGVRSRLFQIPGGIDTSKFRPGLSPLPIPGARGTVFLSIFVWSYRKGWDVLLRAWADAFGSEDDVCLVLRTYKWSATDEVDSRQEIDSYIDRFLHEHLGRTRRSVAPIIVLGKQISEPELPRLFAAASAYVAPSRGEGWGRPHMQAMACGLPVIATRWSGNTEFMSDENSLLLDCEGLVEIGEEGEVGYFRGQRWAEPSVMHLSTLLRRVHEKPAIVAALGQRASQDMVEYWQWKKVAAIAAARLREIQAEIGRAPATATTSVGRGVPVRWEGSQFVYHSLALVNRELCIRLAQDADVDLAILPYEPHEFGPEADPRFRHIAERLSRALSRPAEIHVRHQWPPKLTAPQEGRWVMVQPWEYGSIPKLWIETMRDLVDDVWVPTSYVRDCYLRSGMPADRVHVVPNGVDVSRFNPDARRLPLKTKKRFKFLFVGATIWRKGFDLLLEAYTSTFTAQDDVCLVVKDMGAKSFYKGQTAEKILAQHQSLSHAPEIEYIDRALTDEELPGLFTACDCLVHPYRGEGFGLPIAEAMACGLPVIVTGYGAALDFCTSETAYLIPAREVRDQVKRVADLETVDNPWWGEPDLPALKRLLTQVVRAPLEAKQRGRNANTLIRADFTWERASQVVKERLDALCRQPIRRLAPRGEIVGLDRTGEDISRDNRQSRDREVFVEKWADELAQQPPATLQTIRRASNRAPGKRILVIDPDWSADARPFESQRLLAMLEALSGDGHAVTLIAGADRDQGRCVRHLRQKGVEVYLVDRDRMRRQSYAAHVSSIGLAPLLEEMRYDLAMVAFSEFAAQYLEDIRSLSPQTQVFVHRAEADLISEDYPRASLQQFDDRTRAADVRRRELAFYRRADVLIAETEESRRRLVAEIPGAMVHTVSHNRCVEESVSSWAEREGLLFVGDFRYSSDADAVLSFCLDVLPRVRAQIPNVSVTIVGDVPPPHVWDLSGNGVVVIGSLSEAEQRLRACRVLVAPRRHQGGARGIVEAALASGLPVVTTRSYAATIVPESEMQILSVADDVQTFADAIVRTHRDEGLWRALSEGGRAHVEVHHSRAVFSKQMELLLAELRVSQTTPDRLSERSRTSAASARRADPASEHETEGSTPAPVTLLISAADRSEPLGACLDQLQRFRPEASLSVKIWNRRRPIPTGWAIATAASEATMEEILRAAVAAAAPYVALLSADVIVTKGWLDSMLQIFAMDPTIAVVGPVSNAAPAPQRIKQEYRSLKRELEKFAAERRRDHRLEWTEVPYLGGFCLLLSTGAVRRIGGLGDGSSLTDLLWNLYRRLRDNGFKLACADGVYVHHDRLTQAEGADYKMRANVEAALSTPSHVSQRRSPTR